MAVEGTVTNIKRPLVAITLLLGAGCWMSARAGAQVVEDRVVVLHVGLALGHGFLQRTGRGLDEYILGVQNAQRSMAGRSFSASAGVSIGSHVGILGEYTLWYESHSESYRSFLLGPTLRVGGRNALLARVAIGRVQAPIAEEWFISFGGEGDYHYELSSTSGLGGQVSWGVERLLWRGGAVQLLMQWTIANLPDRLGRPIRYDYGTLRAGGVIFLEPRRFPQSPALPNVRLQRRP